MLARGSLIISVTCQTNYDGRSGVWVTLEKKKSMEFALEQRSFSNPSERRFGGNVILLAKKYKVFSITPEVFQIKFPYFVWWATKTFYIFMNGGIILNNLVIFFSKQIHFYANNETLIINMEIEHFTIGRQKKKHNSINLSKWH